MSAAERASLLELPRELAFRQNCRSSPITTRPVILGVDGGGTKTVAAILDISTRRLSSGMSGPSNPYTVGFEQAADNINRAVERALDAAGTMVGDVAAGVIGVASVDSTQIGSQLEVGIPLLRSIANHLIVNDALLAWASGTLGRPGIAVVSGTGSNCVGVDGFENTWRCGGWGHVFDDEGSGYWIGRMGLRAVLRHRDGRDRATALTVQALEHFDVDNVTALSASIQSDPAKDRIATFSPRITAAAAYGDPVAREILEEAGRALGRLAIVAAEHLQLPLSFPVAFVGGTFRANPYLLDAFRTVIELHHPGATIVEPPLPPFGGALLLAARLGGQEGTLDPEWLRLEADAAL